MADSIFQVDQKVVCGITVAAEDRQWVTAAARQGDALVSRRRSLLRGAGRGMLVTFCGWLLMTALSWGGVVSNSTGGILGLILFGVGLAVMFRDTHRHEKLVVTPDKRVALRRLGYPICVACGYDLQGSAEGGGEEQECCSGCGAELDAMPAVGTVTVPTVEESRCAEGKAKREVRHKWMVLRWLLIPILVLLFWLGSSTRSSALRDEYDLWPHLAIYLLIVGPSLYAIRVFIATHTTRRYHHLRVAGFNVCTKCGYLLDDPLKIGSGDSASATQCAGCGKSVTQMVERGSYAETGEVC